MPTTTNTISNEFTPGVLSLLPLFYVGWSDSVLSPTEMKLIHEKLDTLDFLTAEDKTYLIKWTDPLNPPDESTFKKWVNVLKSSAESLPIENKRSLVQLGLEIATSSTSYKNEEIWKSPKTKAALQDIETALGVQHENSSELLMQKVSDNPVKDQESTLKIDSDTLRDALDGDQKEVKDRMRKLLRDPIFKYEIIPDKDEYRAKILAQVKELSKQGVSAYSFPKKYGGLEKKGDHISVFEMLAFSDLSLTIKFGVQFGLFGGAVYMLGTESHHSKYVEALCKSELLGCFAMTETGHGSNVKGLETTATYDSTSQEFIIHSPNADSGKEYIGNAMHSTMAAVFAQLIVDGENHGVHALLVPIRNNNGDVMPGVTVKDCGYKMGLNGVDNGRLWFDNVRIPRENLLDKYGHVDQQGKYTSPIQNPSKRFFTMLGALVVGRICVGMAGNNVAKSALTIATKYALKRRQFAGRDDQPETLILDYPTHQERLFPLIAKSYAYHFALQELADMYVHNESEEGTRKIETLAAGLKSKATWHCTNAVQICREACGGKGYLSENRFTFLKGDSDIFTTFEGDNTVLMQLVAKGLLTEFKQSFHDEGYRAVVKYLYTRFSNTVDEWNVVQTRNTNQDHILSRDFHLDAFNYRKEKMVISLSQRMQSLLKKRIDPQQAFLRCQVHMVAAADAYIDQVTLASFLKAVDHCEDPSSKTILDKMAKLYALTTIQENKGWFLEADYMEGAKTKAIRRVITKLYQEIRPIAGGLVDAFGIPEELLGAEIIL